MTKEEIGSSGEEEQAGPMGGGGVIQLSLYRRGQGTCKMDTSYIKKKKSLYGLAIDMVLLHNVDAHNINVTGRICYLT